MHVFKMLYLCRRAMKEASVGRCEKKTPALIYTQGGVRRERHRRRRRVLRRQRCAARRINAFYYEASGGKYVPYAALMDLEPGVIGASRRSASSFARAAS
jgi:hypothetical protein